MPNELTTQDISNDKIDLIKSTVAKGTTDLEFSLFLHACKRTGLDPLMKQIYAIKRMDRASGKEVMAIQTGIDGYRLIADRTGQYAGSDEPVYTLGEDQGPDVASVTIYKMVSGMRCAFSASARWPEYASGTSPMWKKMPFLMLGKCAEALALRKAFPAELSGVYTHEEMAQADEPKQPEGLTYNEKFQALAPKAQPVPVVPPAPSQAPSEGFIWQVGKEYKGKPITEVPSDSLEFYISDRNKYPKRVDHVEAAKAEMTKRWDDSDKPPKISALCDAYLEGVMMSETVSECQKAMEAGLADENVNVFEGQHLTDTADRRMAILRSPTKVTL